MTERTLNAVKTIYHLYDKVHVYDPVRTKEFSKKASDYFDANGFSFQERIAIMDKVNSMYKASARCRTL